LPRIEVVMTGFLESIIKDSGNEYASIVEEGVEGSDITGFIDTGSYAFNALLSGDVHKGMPDNKIIALAGESATGKTYFAMDICKKFLQDKEDGIVLYFDTEQAITSDMIKDRGIDSSRVAIFPVATVEDFRLQCIKIVDSVLEMPKEERKPMIIVLDSLGMLSTNKEMADTADGKETRDMTRAQLVKSTFRVLTLKLGKAHIPLILTNHTYDVVGSYIPMKEMGGGSGLKYAASTIVYLSKKKLKDGTDVVGNIIKCRLFKSRLTKENKVVEVQLSYDTGLNPYYGLVDLAIKYGIFKKVSTRIELPDGRKVYEKQINTDPQAYFTDEVMDQVNLAAAKEFKYGSSSDEESIQEEENS
jgi:RecA/RadA recombinase